ncbi:MAG: hypothetical protein AAFX99_14565 [Myxococcota bacterium]
MQSLPLSVRPTMSIPSSIGERLDREKSPTAPVYRYPSEACWACIHRSYAYALCIVVLLLSLGIEAPMAYAQGSGESLRLDLKVGVESDSNATRVNGTQGIASDTLTRYFFKLDSASALSRGQSLGLKYRSGGKLFREQRDEDAFLNQVDARYTLFPTATIQEEPWLFTYASASLKDRTERGNQRDYTRGSGTVGLGVRLGPLSLVGGGGYGFFAYKPEPNQSSQGLLATAGLSIDIQDTWLFGLGYVRNERNFEALFNEAQEPREDVSTVLSASLTYEGYLVASLSGSLLDYQSNVDGQTLQRYTLAANVTTPLFWGFLLSGRALIQLSAYPEDLQIDPIDPQQPQPLLVDEDNRNAYTVVLERPIYARVRGELRYALYTQDLGQESANYTRQLTFVGLGVDY